MRELTQTPVPPNATLLLEGLYAQEALPPLQHLHHASADTERGTGPEQVLQDPGVIKLLVWACWAEGGGGEGG
jgi:hypothetical protein